MPYYDRFDICEAWYLHLSLHHGGQDSDAYRRLSKLTRSFTPRLALSYEALTANGKAIFLKLMHDTPGTWHDTPAIDASGWTGYVYHVDLGLGVACSVRARSVEDALEAAIDYADDTKQMGVFSAIEYRLDANGEPTHLEEDEEGFWMVGHTTLRNWDYSQGMPGIPSEQWFVSEYDVMLCDYYNRKLDGYWDEDEGDDDDNE